MIRDSVISIIAVEAQKLIQKILQALAQEFVCIVVLIHKGYLGIVLLRRDLVLWEATVGRGPHGLRWYRPVCDQEYLWSEET